MQIVKACGSRKADLAFVLDSSTSVGPDNFKLQKTFLADIIKGMKVDPQHVRVALITYNTLVSSFFKTRARALFKYKIKLMVPRIHISA